MSKLEALQNSIAYLESAAHNAEQYSRHNCLRISGLLEEGLHAISISMQGFPEAMQQTAADTDELSDSGDTADMVKVSPTGTPESTITKILDLATTLGIDISLLDIDRSHRIGTKKPDKPRDIIVKFTSCRARNAFYSLYRSRISLKLHGFPGVFIN